MSSSQPHTTDSRPHKKAGPQDHKTRHGLINGQIPQNDQISTNITRNWPQAHFDWPSTNDSSNVPAQTKAVADSSSVDGMTPMERWQAETSGQSPWDDVAYVATRSGDNKTGQENDKVEDIGTGTGTDGSSWVPGFRVEGRKA